MRFQEVMLGRIVTHNSPASLGETKIHKVMSEFKGGRLRSGSKTGPKVRTRQQAIAIAMSESRKAASGGY